jgi:predicted transposase/invertase (TIGR01784 family)
MGKFINPFTDVGFKRIFGQEFSKPLLLDFLNCLLVGERRITSLQLLDKEQAAEYDGDRSPIYDVYCETDSGEKIIVEMQNRDQPNFKERTLYYASEAIVRQGQRGTLWDYDIKAVYLVAFTNFTIVDVSSDFRVDAGLTDLKTGRSFSDKLRLIYLQLPLFVKEAEECVTDFERWIYVLKNMETLNRLPWAAQNAVFQRLAEVGEVSALTKDERIKYDYALKKFRDTYNTIRGAEQKGRAGGRAEGRAEVVKAMRSKGYTDEDIILITGISPEELEKI